MESTEWSDRRPDGPYTGANPAYVDWLVDGSMLESARRVGTRFTGTGTVWQYPFATPNPRAAVAKAPVWFTAYPSSMITREGESFLAALGDDELWATLASIGIRAVHTGPVKRAGGITGVELTPSIDGHFDRISTDIDPAFGTVDEFRSMSQAAQAHGGTVIDDIVPAHTGKGPDFRLAEMGVGDYPGIFHMVEIAPEHWPLLPEIPPGADSRNLDEVQEAALTEAGYIVGPLQRVIFGDPGVKDTNWSATAAVEGPDGVSRRWVYLHYFKEGQPSLNWLDPTFAAARLVVGDALHSIGVLGASALRLDANGFLGVEKGAPGRPAWSEGHPLSIAANQLVASMVRKLGGFTFQELNLTIDDIRTMGAAGADLSYDFVNRPAYHHALATGDTAFLRLTLTLALRAGVSTGSLIHALQNHDEVTYELVHFADLHRDDLFDYRGEQVRGADLAVRIRGELIDTLTGAAGPYNAIFTTNGISSTTASVVCAALGLRDLDALTDDDVAAVRRAHLLLAGFNALQPGVFALSGWDLTGMLPLSRESVAPLLADGDTRWIHRGGYDLLGHAPDALASAGGMPRGRSLYGTLPDQLADPDSFVSRLRDILAVRDRLGLATGRQVDVPDVDHPGVLVMVHDQCADEATTATVLNVGPAQVTTVVRSAHLPVGAQVRDELTGMPVGVVAADGSVSVRLVGHGMACLGFTQR